jgi:pyruvate, water dikinase
MTDSGSSMVVSTGIEGLDAILDGLRIGDNVVWRVDDIDDYRRFVAPFVAAASAQGRQIIYLRFAQHAPCCRKAPACGRSGLKHREVSRPSRCRSTS